MVFVMPNLMTGVRSRAPLRAIGWNGLRRYCLPVTCQHGGLYESRTTEQECAIARWNRCRIMNVDDLMIFTQGLDQPFGVRTIPASWVIHHDCDPQAIPL